MTEPLEKLIDVYEVAALLDLHPGTIRKWVREGTFPAPIVMSSMAQRWRPSVIAQWLEVQSASPQDE